MKRLTLFVPWKMCLKSIKKYDPKNPVICMDESSKQQIKEVRQPIPAKPGEPERYDTSSERNGVSNLFIFFVPLGGFRHVEVTNL